MVRRPNADNACVTGSARRPPPRRQCAVIIIRGTEELYMATEDRDRRDDDLLQLVTFSIGSEEFGVDILKVIEIIRTMEITKVPKAPAFVEGAINLRGLVIPIIDLRRRFGLAEKAGDSDTRIIVIEINGMSVGFVVDSVSEVLRIPANTVEPAPPVVAGVDSDYISGVGKLEDRLLILLDLDKLLSADDLESLGASV